MTPRKCARHELHPGELADGPRYIRSLKESRTCPRCRAWALFAALCVRAPAVGRLAAFLAKVALRPG